VNHVSSSSFRTREKSKRWTPEETEQFYEALSKFGTDFSLVQTAMPGRTRKMIKLKYVKEERMCPHRIDAALRRRVEITPADVNRAASASSRRLASRTAPVATAKMGAGSTPASKTAGRVSPRDGTD